MDLCYGEGLEDLELTRTCPATGECTFSWTADDFAACNTECGQEEYFVFFNSLPDLFFYL